MIHFVLLDNNNTAKLNIKKTGHNDYRFIGRYMAA